MNIRKEIQKAVAQENLELAEACFQENPAMTTRYLQMHVYGMPHERSRWIAIEYLGKLAGRHAADEDALFRNIIRRFIWQMCEESANVPWASAEVIGSIIANVEGKQFEEFIGPLFYHTDLNDICYAGLYWVLPSLMIHHADKVEEYLPNTFSWFENYEMADLRGYAALFHRAYPHAEMVPFLKKWVDDTRIATIYSDSNIQEIPVNELVHSALTRIEA